MPKITIDVNDIEFFLSRCDDLELVIEKIGEIINSPELNDALLDIYDPEREPASEELTKAFLAIKQALVKVS